MQQVQDYTINFNDNVSCEPMLLRAEIVDYTMTNMKKFSQTKIVSSVPTDKISKN